MSNIRKISVVIPVFRSAVMLEKLHVELTSVLHENKLNYEIILVDDYSDDNSWDVITHLQQRDEHVIGIKLARNFGQHNALLCGIREVTGDVIVTMDDDLQNPPREIFKLLEKLDQGFDVVYGTPVTQQHGFVRNLASKITKLTLQKSMGAETAAKISAFRVFRTELREAFNNYTSPTVNIDVLLTWGTAKFTSIAVQHDKRLQGKSGYTLQKLIAHAFNMMTGFSTLPLQLASVMGFVFSGMGLLVLMYILIRYLIDGSVVPGFPFIASLVAIFSGVQLFTLGIIGEYIARIHFRTMEKPAYAVAVKTGAKNVT